MKKKKTVENIEKNIYYLLMEYLEHRESLKYITQVRKGENKGFGEYFGCLIFAQLLDGFESRHSKNIIHRDIKPDNIMIGWDDYKFKFIDFGFITDNIDRLNTFIGAHTYAEDIFSLGVSLFVIVTGAYF